MQKIKMASPYMFRLQIIYYQKQIFWGLFIAQTDFSVYNWCKRKQVKGFMRTANIFRGLSGKNTTVRQYSQHKREKTSNSETVRRSNGRKIDRHGNQDHEHI
jgi:hypothetical protein